MKKFFNVAILLLCLGMVAVSCDGNASKTNNAKTESDTIVSNEPIAVDPEPVDTRPHVYACAYDGFVNMREQPDSKSPIVGALRNGPEGAVLLENGEEWTKVDNNGIIGYVYSKYVQDTPTKAVDEGMDMGWLEGWWTVNPSDELADQLLLFDNGTYEIYSVNFCEGGYTEAGTFILEGSTIALTQQIDYVNEERVNSTTILNVNINSKTIEGYKKKPFTTEAEEKAIMKECEEEGYSYDGFLLTKKTFAAEKKANPNKINNFKPSQY